MGVATTSSMEGKEKIVVKTRLKHVLTDQELLKRLREGVERVHTITADTYNLIKLDILTHFQAATHGETHATFDHQTAEAVSEAVSFTNRYVEAALKAAVADTKVGRPCAEGSKTITGRLKALHAQHQQTGAMPQSKTSGENTSFILKYVATEVVTAYKNNVWMHFAKYPKRYVRTFMMSREVARQGVETQWQLPTEDRRRVVREAAAAAEAILYTNDTPSPEFQFLAPSIGSFTKDTQKNAGLRLYDMKVHPERYIPYMLHINRCFQDMGARMYNPLSLRTTFVPGHLHLDTQGLVDLLVHGKEAISTLKAGLESRDIPTTGTRYSLPNLKGKNDFAKQIEKLVSQELAHLVSHKTGAPSFRTAIWQELTKVGSHKHAPLELGNGMVFDNMITTDGYSVSLHYTRKDLYGVTKFNKENDGEPNSKKQKQASKDAFQYVQNLDQGVKDRLLSTATTLLWADPGKGSLLTVGKVIGDEACSHGVRTVSYSGRQRREESSQNRNQKERRSIVERDLGAGCLHDVEVSLGADGASHRSCHMESFTSYLKKRYGASGQILTQLYDSWIFRRHKFRAFAGRKSSEAKFVDRVVEAFQEDGKELGLLYGNWGKNPNMKHQPPSPGIGLRRTVESRIRTYTVDERRTSSVCRDCDHPEIEHPKSRTWAVDGVPRSKSIHHLLRCTNDKCRRWWNRDTLGGLNIGRQGVNYLQHGCSVLGLRCT